MNRRTKENLTIFPMNFPFSEFTHEYFFLVLAHQYSHFYTDVFITFSSPMTDVRNNTNRIQRLRRWQQSLRHQTTLHVNINMKKRLKYKLFFGDFLLTISKWNFISNNDRVKQFKIFSNKIN